MANLPDFAREDNPLDEPAFLSPGLFELIVEQKQLWLAHDQGDVDLLLRPDAADLPAGWLPIQHITWLTQDLLKHIERLYVIQRPDDPLDDPFYADYTQKIAVQAAAESWRGPLYPIQLEALFPTLEHIWSGSLSPVRQDRQRFQQELFNYQHATKPIMISPARRSAPARSSADLPEYRPLIVHADRVQPQAIQWLWEPYLPRGMLVMLDGDPGLGKGLMLIQVATNLSRGLPFLDQSGKPTLTADVEGPQTTLILSAEDSIPHIMIPRLQHAGADLRYIKFLTGWLGPEEEERAFHLGHVAVLRQAIEEVKPVLIILDPLVAYLGDIDMYKANQTRPVMARLKTLAERYSCTMLGVRHPGKIDQGGRLMYRGQGNVDLIGAARSGLWVQPHPTHPETHTIMLQSKTNVGPLGRTLMFSREQGQFAWIGMSRLTESMLTGKGPDPVAMLEAFFWLEETMKPGEVYGSAELEANAEKKDISLKVLKRAKKLLGVRSFQKNGRWQCVLPPLSTTTGVTGVTGVTGTTGVTGYSEPKSKTYKQP